MIALFVIGSSTIALMMLLVVVVGVARAPEGYEDATGFHRGKCPEPTRAQKSQSNRLRAANMDAFNKSNPPTLNIDDAIVSVKNEIRSVAKIIQQKTATRSAAASPKRRIVPQEAVTSDFHGSGGTAVSDSISPFPSPAQESRSTDSRT